MKKEDIETEILKKFKTKRAFAEHIGISENNLNSKLKKPSKKFLIDLEKAGVIDASVIQEYSHNTNIGAEMTGNFNNSNPQENHYHQVHDQQIIKEISEPYKMAIEAKEQTIQMLKERLVEREKRIDELLDMLKNK
jgi:hypothetical protein